MKEIIKVLINEDGVTARQCNPVTIYDVRFDLEKWKKAEAKLKTYTIDFSHLNPMFTAIEKR